MTRLCDPPARYRSPLLKDASYVEEVPVPEYRYASEAAYERFIDLKYGIRIHWGLYSLQQTNASWPLYGLLDTISKGGNFMVCIGPGRNF